MKSTTDTSVQEPYLDIVTPNAHKRLKLSGKPVTIGRAKTNVIAIEEEGSSREHCVIEKTGDGFRLRDLDSTNGTILNGQKVNMETLVSGDRFRIGNTKFIFVHGPPRRKAASSDRAAVSKAPPSSSRRGVARPDGAGASSEGGSGQLGTAAPHKSVAEGKPGGDGTDSAKKRKFSFASLKRRGKAGSKRKKAAKDGLFDPGAAEASDPETVIRRFIAGTADKGIADPNAALRNTRGEVIHEAAVEGEDAEEIADSIRIIQLLLFLAYQTGASDLHFEPRVADSLVRMRMDGTMVDVAHIPFDEAPHITGVVKVLTEIDITQRNIVQEGHFSADIGKRTIDYRVSFTPSMHGQKLVIRVLDPGNAPQHLDDLMLPDWMLASIRDVSDKTAGMVLVCGPTGSGKTTTLYSVLRDIDAHKRNVITIEDPVEYQLEAVTQIPIDEHKGNTFDSLLRSVLRQDPDVILVGEIRDQLTAKTAMQAAMTGHLVLSTVHAKDTVGTIFRLLDLEVEPFLIGSSLNLILAQRLVRLLCPHCKAAKKPTPRELMKMGRRGGEMGDVFYPVGCPRCFNVGYRRRRGLFELLTVTDTIRDVILSKPTMGAINEALKRTVFTSLEDMGWQLVAEGSTPVEEIHRVCAT